MESYGLMTHSFNVDIAVKYGLNEAIILGNIHYWVTKNEANGTNLHEGRYWTYNSIAAFSKLFPYLTPKQIRGALDRLVKRGLILKGNFNKTSIDRTTWYALTDKGYAAFGMVTPHLPSEANGCALSDNSICPQRQMDVPCRANGCAPEGKAIPDVNTDINANITTDELPPTRESVYRFCIENGLNISPDRFFDVNEHRGWVTKSGKPVDDWKKLALTWDKHEKASSTSASRDEEIRKNRTPTIEEVMADYRVTRERAERMIEQGLF